ncbi:MAG TPA: hypothetical protein GXZ37_00800 [Clostridiales bacterium]|nr:hypothetical protein [Clostridiales bacterium]
MRTVPNNKKLRTAPNWCQLVCQYGIMIFLQRRQTYASGQSGGKESEDGGSGIALFLLIADFEYVIGTDSPSGKK